MDPTHFYAILHDVVLRHRGSSTLHLNFISLCIFPLNLMENLTFNNLSHETCSHLFFTHTGLMMKSHTVDPSVHLTPS